MFIKNLKEISKEHINSTIELCVLFADVKIKVAKNDRRYADIIIQDRTKSLEAKLWDYDQYENLFESGGSNIFDIKAVVGEYQGQVQLTLKEIKPYAGDSISIKDLIPTSSWNYESMIKTLKNHYEKIQSPHLRELVSRMIFSDNYFEKFTTYPAATRIHHNFFHGLMHHTLEILYYAQTVGKLKKLTHTQMDRLIVICMLHDWAKIFEYKALPESGFTDQGIMLGHIFIGAHHTSNVIDEIEGFPYEDRLVILNGILGHHGNLEWGSPVLPKTVESQILHHCDKMSGDIESILSFISESPEDEIFTNKLWNMGTEFYTK